MLRRNCKWWRRWRRRRRRPGTSVARCRSLGRSQPRAEFAFQQGGGVSAAHQPQHVQQVRDGRGLPVPGLPQVQYLVGGTGLDREIVYVPVSMLYVIIMVNRDGWAMAVLVGHCYVGVYTGIIF